MIYDMYYLCTVCDMYTCITTTTVTQLATLLLSLKPVIDKERGTVGELFVSGAQGGAAGSGSAEERNLHLLASTCGRIF